MIVEIKPFGFNIYAAMLILSVMSGLLYFYIKMFKSGIDKLLLTSAVLIEGLMIFFCGAAMSSVMNKDATLLSSGFTSTGGAIGIILSTILFCFMFRPQRKCIIDSNSEILPLVYAVSKTGCFFSGCCHGRKSELFAVKYSGSDMSFIPVQLYETIVFILIFIYVRKSENKLKSSITLCCCAKFLLDFLREPTGNYILSPNQIVCVLIFTAVTIIMKISDSHSPQKSN